MERCRQMGAGMVDGVYVTITGEAERKDQRLSMWFAVWTIYFAFTEEILLS